MSLSFNFVWKGINRMHDKISLLGERWKLQKETSREGLIFFLF